MSIFRQFFTLVFGNIVWRPPGWLRVLGDRARFSRRSVALAAILVVATAAGSWRAYEWYKHRPKPVTVKVTAEPIPITKLEEKLHFPPLILRFGCSAAPLEAIGKPVRAGVRLDPPAEGEWKWEDGRRLVFTPRNDWPADTKYRVTLDRKALAPHVLLDRYEVETRTVPFCASITKFEFYQDPKDYSKRMVATLAFTHSIAPGELEKHLSLTALGSSQVFKKGAAPFSVGYGMHRRIAYVNSAEVALPEHEDFIKLDLDKNMTTAQGGATLKAAVDGKARIPDQDSFFKIKSVTGTIVRNEAGDPEQILVVNTTAEAKPAEIAKAFEVYLLPKKPIKEEEASNDANTDDSTADDDTTDETEPQPQWTSPREVDDVVLKDARPVTVNLVPSDRESSKQHLFKIKLESDGDLYVRIKKSARALGDFTLGHDYDAVLPVPLLPREITIQGDGGVLAMSGERKLSIKSRGVELIEYEIARVPAAEINHLVSQTSGNFQNPEFLHPRAFGRQDIARIATEKQPIHIENRFKANYSTFDFSTHLGPADDGSPMQGLFFLTARAWDAAKKKYVRDVCDSRFILVTDIGVLVKEDADGARDIFLQSLKAREPLGGVTVDILGRNGVSVVSGITGANGQVHFASLGKPTREKEPVAIVARNGGDVAFIPYARRDRKLDFSRFDIGGVESSSGADLDAFVFTERGVYRPGDAIHVAFTVKQRDWGGDLAGLPLETEVVDARGTAVQVKKTAIPTGGFAEFTFQTAYASPTGDYSFNVYLLHNGKRDILLGSTGALVKEFLPDRMKIESHLSKTVMHGWIDPEDVKAAVTLRNLYGTAASDRRIVARMELCPSGFRFDEYRDYTFFDRLRETKDDVHNENVELGEQKTDGEGAAQFDLDLQRFRDATYRMTFFAEGFEADGGRSVNTSSSALVSALPYVVGYKPDGDFHYVKMNSERSADLIAIDHALKKIPVGNLQLNVIEQKYVSVLKLQEDETYAYESVRKENVVQTATVSIPDGGLTYALPTGAPGDYFIELREPGSGVRVCKFEFNVVGLGPVSRSLDKNAELDVKLDRKQYNAGDEIEVSITAPYTGSGLITIERDKVYASQWFKADQTGSVQRIKLPDGFDGTGYVNVSFIRALDSREIFMSPLSYGVVPFTANREKRSLKIDLHAAAIARPGEPHKIGYKADRPAKIVVFAVDQGILQVTGYETPNPLDYYFRKAALMVQTSQIVDLILPEYSILRSAAFGGDGEERHLNPFKRVTEKPVVFWSGVIDADTTAREVVYDVPDYFSGTLTIMAVAVSPNAVGAVERDSLIRGPFVITPGVPTLAAPGDQFEVGVTVANNVTGSGENAEIALAAVASEHLEIVQSPPQPMRIAEGREASAAFTVRVKEKLGSASLTFKASANGQESQLRSTLSVRPPVPLMTDVRGGNFTKESIKLPVEREMLPEYRSLEAVVSSVPLGLAHGLDVYLKNYPNGCSEQLTSGAFCRLVICDDADFGLTRAEVFAQLEKTFDVLRRRQNDQGAFGYWAPGSNDGIDFISTYVMHFLIEAKTAGFVPPADVFQSGLRNLQRMVIKEPRSLADARTVAYAIYLLTREEVITTNYILNLRDYLDKNHPKEWQRDLTGVYLAGALSMLKKDAEAQKLIGAYRIGVHDERERCDFYQPLGADSQYVAVVARHFPDMLKRISAKDFETIVEPIARGDFNTLSAAYAVLALKSYSEHIAQHPPQLGIFESNKEKRETELAAEGKLLKRVEFSANAASLRFSAKPQTSMGAFYQVIETGFDRHLPSKAITDGIEVFREFVNKDGNVTNTARLGEPLTVRLKIRSLKHDALTNVAIVDLLPGGFEIVGSSLRPGAGSCGCDYVEVREDRAVFFTSVSSDVRSISYQIKPGNRGEFVVPPVFAESMYDRSIKARGLPGRITVTDSK